MSNEKNPKALFTVKNIVLLGLLTALLFIMAYTPLGYLNIGPLAITFNVIPVGIGAIILGWKGGLILGGVFGLTSFLQTFGSSALGTLLMSINPPLTIVQCFVPRLLMGMCVGLAFGLLSKLKVQKEASFAVCGFLSAFLNTCFYMSSLILLFGDTDFIQDKWSKLAPGQNAIVFIALFVGVNAVVEAITSTLLVTGIVSVLYRSRLVKFPAAVTTE